MELLLARPAEFDRIYNCSGINIAKLETETSRKFVWEAWATIALCTIYTCLYIPCIYSIIKHIENNACYKLLLYIGLTDVANLWLLGFLHGWLSLNGIFYCSHPMLMYWSGLGVTFFWMAESSCDLILALNRCIDMLWHDLAERLFAGWRIWLWLSVCTTYALYWLLFKKPAIFSSLFFAWFFDPFIGIREDKDDEFVVHLHTYHESIVGIASPIIYMIFCIAIKLKYRTVASPQEEGVSDMIFLQVFAISAMNTFACILYAILERLHPSQWVVTMAQFAWFSPVIYLALNKTMRADCRKLLFKLLFPRRVNRVNGVTVVDGQQKLAAMNTTRIIGAGTMVPVPIQPMPMSTTGVTATTTDEVDVNANE